MPNNVGEELAYAVELFETELRWIGVVYDAQGRVSRLSLFHDRKQDVLTALGESLTPRHRVCRRGGVVRAEIEKYAAGGVPDFNSFSLSPCNTSFQNSVRSVCRRIGYGNTATYGEIARNAGSPGAARAVGACMKNNPIPIIVPCHRVIGSGNRLVGFSVGSGTSLKEELLRMEGVNQEFVN